jgi:hypothetical protein
MQSFYAECFERDMGCTPAEWLGWLPQAIGANFYELSGPSVTVQISLGQLQLTWQEASPRQIGLARIPRLLVSFKFSQLDATQRYTFMKRFDLYMQRGGG